MRPQFDERDAELLAERQKGRDELSRERGRPLVGDVVILPDRTRVRVTHCYDDGAQTTIPGWDASFYWHRGGGAEFSGSLASPIPYSRWHKTRFKRPSRGWFFHHDHVAAHNGVPASLYVTVWIITR